jgi:translation initiation factor 4E
MWEDENCKDGGRWSLRVPKTHTNKYWEDLLLALIGEQFTHDNEILGIVIALKPNQDTISIWHRNGTDQTKIQQIKEDIARIVAIDEQTMKLDYENFAETLSKPKPEKAAFTRNIPGGDTGE